MSTPRGRAAVWATSGVLGSKGAGLFGILQETIHPSFSPLHSWGALLQVYGTQIRVVNSCQSRGPSRHCSSFDSMNSCPGQQPVLGRRLFINTMFACEVCLSPSGLNLVCSVSLLLPPGGGVREESGTAPQDSSIMQSGVGKVCCRSLQSLGVWSGREGREGTARAGSFLGLGLGFEGGTTALLVGWVPGLQAKQGWPGNVRSKGDGDREEGEGEGKLPGFPWPNSFPTSAAPPPDRLPPHLLPLHSALAAAIYCT